MHSWVFRNRLRLEQLYGVPKRALHPSILPVEELAVSDSVVPQSLNGDQLQPWPSVERRDDDVVVLHPAISGVPRIKRLPIYRRGA
ncbi:MAG: hypothetical protein P8N31_10625 [Planctomycetota bacterium]|nr:hypothetical protein [Planctomycetota bacterium]MDG2143999.1 hypothetical protein [Planctomycetota bacterium]